MIVGWWKIDLYPNLVSNWSISGKICENSWAMNGVVTVVLHWLHPKNNCHISLNDIKTYLLDMIRNAIGTQSRPRLSSPPSEAIFGHKVVMIWRHLGTSTQCDSFWCTNPIKPEYTHSGCSEAQWHAAGHGRIVGLGGTERDSFNVIFIWLTTDYKRESMWGVWPRSSRYSC